MLWSRRSGRPRRSPSPRKARARRLPLGATQRCAFTLVTGKTLETPSIGATHRTVAHGIVLTKHKGPREKARDYCRKQESREEGTQPEEFGTFRLCPWTGESFERCPKHNVACRQRCAEFWIDFQDCWPSPQEYHDDVCVGICACKEGFEAPNRTFWCYCRRCGGVEGHQRVGFKL